MLTALRDLRAQPPTRSPSTLSTPPGNRSARATIVASTDPCQDTQAPTAPAGIVAQTRTETSITLSWQASTDAGGVAGYRVFRDGALAGSTNSTSYTVAGLSCGKSYTFGLEAYDPSANHSARTATIFSTAACSDTVAPSAPASFVKTGATTTSIAVSWSPASDNVAVAGYSLSVAGSAIGTTAQPSYTFSGLACGTSYALGIEAYDAAGNRSPRITLQADAAACASSPPTPPPSPPPSQGLANVFAVPPTSTDGSTNCVRSATPKTYEQALAASPKNVCAYVVGVKTSWDMACNAATAGDLVGVRPGVYETVGGGGYLLGSNEIGQDCSDGARRRREPEREGAGRLDRHDRRLGQVRPSRPLQRRPQHQLQVHAWRPLDGERQLAPDHRGRLLQLQPDDLHSRPQRKLRPERSAEQPDHPGRVADEAPAVVRHRGSRRPQHALREHRPGAERAVRRERRERDAGLLPLPPARARRCVLRGAVRNLRDERARLQPQ